MTRVIEFQHTIERDPPLTVRVRAVLRHVTGEPGSICVADGWEVDELSVSQPSAEPRVTEPEMLELERLAIARV